MSGIPGAATHLSKSISISDERFRVNSAEDLNALKAKLAPRGSNRGLERVGDREVKVVQLPGGLIGYLKSIFSTAGRSRQRGIGLLERALKLETIKRHSEHAVRDEEMSRLAAFLLRKTSPKVQSLNAPRTDAAATTGLTPSEVNDMYKALRITDEQEAVMRDHIKSIDPMAAALSDHAKLKESLCMVMKASAQTLRDDFQNNWERARHQLAHSEDSQDKARMGELIVFRRILVDSLVNSLRQPNAEPEDNGKGPGKHWTPLVFDAQAVGSTALTSDYDLTLNAGQSSDDVRAIRRFNRDIELMFGVQPGTLLDTNLYAGDYGEPRETLSKNWKSKQQDPAASKAPTTGAAALDEVDALHQRALLHLSNDDQHIVALTKLRMSLSDGDWQHYGESLIHNLEHSGAPDPARKSYEVFDSADAIWTLQTAKLVTAVIADLPNETFKFGDMTLKHNAGQLNLSDYQFIPILQGVLSALESQHPDLCLKTRNALYLESIEATKALSSYDALPGEDKNVRKLRAIGQSLYFAPEAYYTAGAVRHVVEGIQLSRADAIKTLRDTVAKEPAHWRTAQAVSGLDRISRDDLLASAIEQVADSFCHASDDSPVKFLVNGSKYLGRMLDAVSKLDELSKRADQGLESPAAPLGQGIVSDLLDAGMHKESIASQITTKELALILKVTALATKKEELQLDAWEVNDLKALMDRTFKAPLPAGAQSDRVAEAVFGKDLTQYFEKILATYEDRQSKTQRELEQHIKSTGTEGQHLDRTNEIESLSAKLSSGIKISLATQAANAGEKPFKELVDAQLARLFSANTPQSSSGATGTNTANAPAAQSTSFQARLLKCLAQLETAAR